MRLCGINCTCPGWAKPLQDGIGPQNPVLIQVLGICSALAVTGYVSTTLVMGAGLLFVTSLSSLTISLMRNLIPRQVRMIAEMLVVSVLVIVVHLYLQAYWFDMSRALGPYVGLIITNCIVMGRCEAYAIRNRPLPSFLDGLGSAAGYALVLLVISLVREPLGSGTLLGCRVMPGWWTPVMLVSMAPGAFLVMGVVVWIVRTLWPDRAQTSAHPEGGGGV